MDAPGAVLESGGSPLCRLRRTCRICGGAGPRRFLSLGPTPLANSFLTTAEPADEMVFPLDVYFCPGCSLVQLLDVVDPEVLFRDYIYVTGTSDTMAEHNRGYAGAVGGMLGLGTRDLVVEIASNDGSLLDCFRRNGVRTLGVEPARNIAAQAIARGIDTVPEFFTLELARRLRAERGPARAVVANNVLAHVDEPVEFLRGAADLIEGDGLVVAEVPYLGELVRKMEYDTIYHEHLCYFSITALLRLCEAAGLSVVRLNRYEIHGGSLRLYARRRDQCPSHDAAVLAEASAEEAAGLTRWETFQDLAVRVADHGRRLRALLEQLQSQGRTLAGYGAPAKGNTLLNYCGIGRDLLPYIVDKNPMKVGKYTPGARIPVLPVATLLERHPDCVLILAWNFGEEIMRQQAEYRRRGGRFLLPIPEPRIV